MMYRTIVVGTDCSPTATIAVMKAAELAQLTGAKLYLVSAYPAAAKPAPNVQDFAFAYTAAGGGAVLFDPDGHESADALVDRQLPAIGAERRVQIESTASGLRRQGIDVETRVEVGGAASTLVRLADTLDADLLVVGDRGLKGLRGALGSVPDRVTHRARLDVLVVHTT
jgi:nucleotide-binding universal stress UspA family protein